MTPYYSDSHVTIYHGDCRNLLPSIEADVIVTDPPYGIAYKSGHEATLPRSIIGDQDASLRDWLLETWAGPALIFGTWRVARPSR